MNIAENIRVRFLKVGNETFGQNTLGKLWHIINLCEGQQVSLGGMNFCTMTIDTGTQVRLGQSWLRHQEVLML